MPRNKNPDETVKIAISTVPQVADLLDQLTLTGLFGRTRTTVAETLLLEKLRELIRNGELKPGGNE